jgi:hypothetical protein
MQKSGKSVEIVMPSTLVNGVTGRNNAPCHVSATSSADHAKRSAHKLKISGHQILPHPPIPLAADLPLHSYIACTTPPIMNPFGLELPPIGASYDAPFSASSRFPSSSYDLRSYARPQKTTRNDIGKSMRPKPTRKDIRESIQSKPTTSRKITPPEDAERENNPVQPRNDSYDKAHDFVTRFDGWHSGKLAPPNSYPYAKKFTMSTKEWIKLSSELKLSESDDQSVSLLQSIFLFYSTKRFNQVPQIRIQLSHLDSHHPMYAYSRSRVYTI